MAKGVWQITCEHCDLMQQLPRIPVLPRMTMIWMSDEPYQYMKCKKWRYAMHKAHVHAQLSKTETDSRCVTFCYTLTVYLVTLMLSKVHLHEVGLQQTFTGLYMVAAHQAQVVGLSPIQGWRFNPEPSAALCRDSMSIAAA